MRYISALSVQANPSPVWEQTGAERAEVLPYTDGNVGALNVRAYGAKGDKVTNDTVAMRTALAEAHAHGRPLWLPAGIYKITGPLTVYPNTRLFGDGHASVIWFTGVVLSGAPGSHSFNGTGYHLFNLLPGPGAFVVRTQNVIIEHLRICGDNGPSDVNPNAGAFAVVDLGAQVSGGFAVYIPSIGAFGEGPSEDVWIRHCFFEHLFSFTNGSAGGRRQHFTNNRCIECSGDTNFNADDSHVTDNLFDKCWGVENAGQRVLIARNTFTNGIAPHCISVGGANGMTFYTGDNGPDQRGIFGSQVIDNLIDNPLGGGILVNSGCVGTIVSRNIITRVPSGKHGISQNSEWGPSSIPSYCTVEDNVFMSIGLYALWFGGGGYRNAFRRNKVLRNQVVGAADTFGGFLIQNEIDAILEGNEVNALGVDYAFGNCTRLVFMNNVGDKLSFGDTTSTFRTGRRSQTVETGGTVDIGPLVDTVRVTHNGATSPRVAGAARTGPGHRITISNAASQLGTSTVVTEEGTTIVGQPNFPLVGPRASVTLESDNESDYQVVHYWAP